jgi:electron transfer flavoprotein beta subunit
MKRIIVLVKDTPDLSGLKIDPSNRRPLLEGVKRRLGDLDKRALEAAIRVKETVVCEVITLSVGDEKTKTTILEALAMGADSAYIVNDEALRKLDACVTSLVLAAAVRKIGDYDLIVLGELSLDTLSAQVGPRLSEILDLPQMTYAREFKLGDGKVTAVRDLEDVDEVIEASLPSLVSVIREINEPRIPSLMNIMKAKKKPIIVWRATDLGFKVEELKAASSIEVLDVVAPEVKRKRIVIKAETAEQVSAKLVEVLMSEGVLEGQ